MPKSSKIRKRRSVPGHVVFVTIVSVVGFLVIITINLQRQRYSNLVYPTSQAKRTVSERNGMHGSTQDVVQRHEQQIDTNFNNLERSTLPDAKYCISDYCVYNAAQSISRAFIGKPQSKWCKVSADVKDVSSNSSSKLWQGLLYVRVPKTGSSTIVGATFRIHNKTNCAMQYQHVQTGYKNRDPLYSFLFASVRLPHRRAISAVWYYHVQDSNYLNNNNNNNNNNNDQVKYSKAFDKFVLSKLKISYFVTSRQGSFQTDYISPQLIPQGMFTNKRKRRRSSGINLEQIVTLVGSILDHYDFIIINERMDESLVALSILLDLDVTNVIVADSKTTGSHVLERSGKYANQCRFQKKTFISPAVAEYFNSTQWRAQNYADYVLYQAANISLDQTIAKIGKERFETAYKKYKLVKGQIPTVCGPDYATAVSGCTDSGQKIDNPALCYHRDSGCGYQCIDTIVDMNRN